MNLSLYSRDRPGDILSIHDECLWWQSNVMNGEISLGLCVTKGTAFFKHFLYWGKA